MVSRKRAAAEMEAEEPAADTSLLHRLRNDWAFAGLMQYIFMFGKAVKIDENFDIEDLETECLKVTPSEELSKIGLALLKNVSSHKGLTPDLFDEYTRRQYVAKAPQRNPFGEEETPNKFVDLDVFTKIRVLYQLSVWTLINPDRIKEKMDERDETEWRMEPIGWDAEDNAYYVFDDNRLYRKTNAPLPSEPPPKRKAKAKPKPKKKGSRASKRRKVSQAAEDEDEGEEADESIVNEEEATIVEEDDGFGGAKWECVAITLTEYQDFIESIRKTRDPNQKKLRDRLTSQVIPIIEKREEAQERKRQRQLKELENIQKLATAKRSSRLAGKQEQRKAEEEAAAGEQKRLADLAMARKEQEKQKKMEQDRESRMMTREQRLKEREVKRILHEEELKRLEEEKEKLEANEAEGRHSERHMQNEMQRRQKELERLQELQEEDAWVFDCAKCGVYGENLDDGSHSIQCEKCNVWQHSACHGISQAEADREDFHFVCADCKRKAEDAEKAKSLKIKITKNTAASGTPARTTQDAARTPTTLNGVVIPPPYSNGHPGPPHNHVSPGSVMNGPSLSPQGQSAGPPGAYQPPPRTGGYMFPPVHGSVAQPQYSPPPHEATHTPSMPAYARPRHQPLASAPRQPVQHVLVPHPAIQPRPTPPTQSVQAPRPNFTAYHQLEYPNAVSHQQRMQQPRPSSSQSNQSSRVIHHDPFQNSFSRVKSPAKSPTAGSHATPNGAHPYPAPTYPPSHATATPRPTSQGHQAGAAPFSTPLSAAQSPYTNISPRPDLPSPAPGFSPEKHDGPRPVSSHAVIDMPVLPAPQLSPNASFNIPTPPVKKATPDRVPIQQHGPPPVYGGPATATMNGTNGTTGSGANGAA